MNISFNITLTSLALCFVLASCHSKDKDTNEKPRPAVRVETLTVSGTSYDNARIYSGTLSEEESSNISFATAGTIKSFNVSEGDRVTKGQVIGTLDDANLISANEIAQATLAQARDAYNRMKLLHDANSLPEIKWVDVQQKLKQAESAADIAANALGDAVLRAPFSGIVAEKYADLGQTIAPGLPVVKLIRIADVKAVISVAQAEVSKFHEGDKAVITFEGNDKQYEGTLVDKGISANPLSRTFEMKYIINNNDSHLLPGMICSVKVAGEQSNGVFLLPQSAVLLDEHNRNFVWLDSMGTACKRIVEVTQLNAGGLEIHSGLIDGDKVIVKGQQKVSNGTQVESINE